MAAGNRVIELSKNFTSTEFGLDAVPDGAERDRLIENARALCAWVLQPIRDHYQAEYKVTSGYRNPDHNRMAGGKPKSYHLFEGGKAAADGAVLTIPRTSMFQWIINFSDTPFDRCILEYDKQGRPDVVHLQINRFAMPRRLALIGETGDGETYVPVPVPKASPRVQAVWAMNFSAPAGAAAGGTAV